MYLTEKKRENKYCSCFVVFLTGKKIDHRARLPFNLRQRLNFKRYIIFFATNHAIRTKNLLGSNET